MPTVETVQLGNVLRRRKEEVLVRDDAKYARLTIRMNGRGIDLRDTVSGFEIGTKRQFIARKGQLVLSKIDARNGAFGVLPDHCDRAIITGNFWAFDIDMDRLLPKYFDYLTQTPLFLAFCVRASEGTTNRRYLQEPAFLRQAVELPPLDTQRHIVKRIEELAAKIGEATDLRSASAGAADRIWAQQAIAAFDSVLPATPPTLDDVAHIVGGQSLPEIIDPQSVQQGIHLIKVSDMNRKGNEVHIHTTAQSLEQNSPLLRGMRLVPAGAVILPKRGGAIATNKKRILTRSAVLDPNVMAIFPKDNLGLSSDYLFAWLKTIDLSSMQDGTSVPQINKSDFAPLRFPLISIKDQRTVVSQLKTLEEKLSSVKALQSQTAAELDAMLPAILDRAFKGEL